MNRNLGISLIFIIFLAIGISGCLGNLKTISKQVTIQYGLTGNDAGTLHMVMN